MPQVERVVQLALLMGEMLLRSGAETSRVEDTCQRILSAYGLRDSSVLAITTGVFVTAYDGNDAIAQLRRVERRTLNLTMLDELNALARQITAREVDLNDAFFRLQTVSTAGCKYPLWLQLFAAGTAGSCFAYLFGAQASDLPAALVIGMGTYLIAVLAQRKAPRFFADFLAAFFAALAAQTTVLLRQAENSTYIIVGSIMLLVPGILLTTAVQDAMHDDLLSSVAKVTEAVFVALAIAGGVTLALRIGGQLL